MVIGSNALYLRSNTGRNNLAAASHLERNLRCGFSFQSTAKSDMPMTGPVHQWRPNRVDQSMFDQEMPETIGTFVEIRHREVRRHGRVVRRPTTPDGGGRKQPPIQPVITLRQFLRGHVLRLKDHMRSVILRPI